MQHETPYNFKGKFNTNTPGVDCKDMHYIIQTQQIVLQMSFIIPYKRAFSISYRLLLCDTHTHTILFQDLKYCYTKVIPSYA